MFQKKYSPIVLTEASMLTLHHMQTGLQFILGDQMDRILHMTMDSTKGNDDGYGKQFLSTEFEVCILIKNGKALNMQARVQVYKHDGFWTIGLGSWDRSYFLFLNRRLSRRIEMSFEFYVKKGEIRDCSIQSRDNKSPVSYEVAISPDDESMVRIRKLLSDD